MNDSLYDCIIIGAGPGGIQAAIHLARYNRNVLLLDRPGGRTRHAWHIENYLGHKLIAGKKLIDTGLDQIKSFNVHIEKASAVKVLQNEYFEVYTKEQVYKSKFVIASSGATENLPHIKNMNRFFGKSLFTCVDCDGYRTTGKKLVLLGKSLSAARLAVAMKQMFTSDITLVMTDCELPAEDNELLLEDEINCIFGKPVEFLGDNALTGIKLDDGSIIDCEVVMANYGFILNDSYLAELPLERDTDGFKFITNNCESSVNGLYVTGALKQGNAQAVIAAGQGAAVAIEINKKLLEI